jgi:hypothetical protein
MARLGAASSRRPLPHIGFGSLVSYFLFFHFFSQAIRFSAAYQDFRLQVMAPWFLGQIPSVRIPSHHL